MKIVMFYHSMLSDWRNSDAHFLRGITRELAERGHSVELYEPAENPHLSNLLQKYGDNTVARLKHCYPSLKFNTYTVTSGISKIIDNADLVIVSDYTNCDIVEKLPSKNFRNYKLVLHLLHNQPCSDIENYDGILTASGAVVETLVTTKAIWNTAADTRLFYPKTGKTEADVLWTGDWFEEEESYIYEYIITPVQNLKLKATIVGTGFPQVIVNDFKAKGINYIEWIPNYEIPSLLAKHKLAINFALSSGIGSSLSLQQLMACGIPVLAVIKEQNGLFTTGHDYMFANSGAEVQAIMQELINDRERAVELTVNASRTVNRKHTCFHRANELEIFCEKIGIERNKIYPNGNIYRLAV